MSKKQAKPEPTSELSLGPGSETPVESVPRETPEPKKEAKESEVLMAGVPKVSEEVKLEKWEVLSDKDGAGFRLERLWTYHNWLVQFINPDTGVTARNVVLIPGGDAKEKWDPSRDSRPKTWELICVPDPQTQAYAMRFPVHRGWLILYGRSNKLSENNLVYIGEGEYKWEIKRMQSTNA